MKFQFLHYLSIKTKLIITIMGISSLMLLSSLSIFMNSELNSLKKTMIEDLSTLADLIGNNSEGALMFLDSKAAGEILMALKAKPHIISADIFYEDAQPLSGYHRDKDIIPVNQLAQTIRLLKADQNEINFYRDDQIHLVRRIIFDQDNSTLGFIYIRSDREFYWQRVSEYLSTTLVIIIFALIFTWLLALQAQKIFLSPILQLLGSMRYVSKHQDYSKKLQITNTDEFADLINGYNKMLIELEQQSQLKQNYQDDLESRVKERTQQLKIARDEALSASRTKSAFLANMSHEIRTPMNAILGYTQLLQQSSLNKEQLRKLLIIDESGKHLLSLINDILELSKIEAGSLKVNLEDFDLLALLKSIEDMFKIRCDQKNIGWHMTCFTDQSILVHGDAGKLRQILINLIGNACKFTDQGAVNFNIEQIQSNCYLFTISDSGIGIDSEALTRIFDAFHQEKQGEQKGGTGLGLNITRRHIELLNSHLQVESKINHGSRFFFELELVPAKNAINMNPNSLNSLQYLPAESTLSALVVDDVKNNTDLLGSILENMGFTVFIAHNGQSAINIISHKLPNIVFMDIRMPVMNGVEAIKVIRNQWSSKQLKCVAVSASGLKHNAQFFIDEGYDLFISKPFRMLDIFDAVGEMLNIKLQVGNQTDKHNQVVANKIPLKPIKLDEDLAHQLKHAAEFGQLTELKKLIIQLNKSSDTETIANHLELLISSADLNGITNYVETIIND